MACPANRHWKRKNINRSFGWLLVGGNKVDCHLNQKVQFARFGRPGPSLVLFARLLVSRKGGRAHAGCTQGAAMFRLGGIITMKECSAVRLRARATLDFSLQALWRGGEVRCKVLSRLRNCKTGFTAASIHHQADCSGTHLARATAYRVPTFSSSGNFAMFARDAPRFVTPGQALGRRGWYAVR